MAAPINNVDLTFVGSENALKGGMTTVLNATLSQFPAQDRPILNFHDIGNLSSIEVNGNTVIGAPYTILGASVGGVDAVTEYIRRFHSKVPVVISGLRAKHENDEIKQGTLPNCADIGNMPRDLPLAIRIVLGLHTLPNQDVTIVVPDGFDRDTLGNFMKSPLLKAGASSEKVRIVSEEELNPETPGDVLVSGDSLDNGNASGVEGVAKYIREKLAREAIPVAVRVSTVSEKIVLPTNTVAFDKNAMLPETLRRLLSLTQ